MKDVIRFPVLLILFFIELTVRHRRLASVLAVVIAVPALATGAFSKGDHSTAEQARAPTAAAQKHRSAAFFTSKQQQHYTSLLEQSDLEGTIPPYQVGSDSYKTDCADGTRNLGVQDGYIAGVRARLRLCALTGVRSYSEESKPGSMYYISRANGEAMVNSVASYHFAKLLKKAKVDGITLAANSSFRTMAHQQSLWNGNPNPTFVAHPGYSNHQQGAAIDFWFPSASLSSGNCRTINGKCTLSGDPVWNWLDHNAPKFGVYQYVNEFWHFSPSGH